MKKLENVITYSCYHYAPEQFKLSVKSIGEIKLDYQTASKLGNLYVTGNIKELEKQIKSYMRNKTVLSKKIRNVKIGIRTDSKNGYIFICDYTTSNRFDIKSKLEQYKDLMCSYNTKNNSITVTEAKMTSFGKFEKTNEYKPQEKLLKRVILINC